MRLNRRTRVGIVFYDFNGFNISRRAFVSRGVNDTCYQRGECFRFIQAITRTVNWHTYPPSGLLFLCGNTNCLTAKVSNFPILKI